MKVLLKATEYFLLSAAYLLSFLRSEDGMRNLFALKLFGFFNSATPNTWETMDVFN